MKSDLSKTNRMKDIKLSEKQKEVIDLMRNGWELGSLRRQANAWTPLPIGYRLQKGGLGSGGDVKKINHRTFFFLLENGLIRTNDLLLDSIKYQLTELGKTIKL